ncbi:hypothetical protein FHS55_002103 [Angulomicrobium tetraedrale]|uniref:Uncharacterized protein n=1 Tax=Ancylobacter tetraedralis TaxID=217068 RepID=A0A839Z9T9_9HYPH|nr:hypothetical protein [Ancylobacter tetraedralis]MBB3771504.1 hypothetical protein [Ancylobacter tetraedralis]
MMEAAVPDLMLEDIDLLRWSIADDGMIRTSAVSVSAPVRRLAAAGAIERVATSTSGRGWSALWRVTERGRALVPA